MRRPRDDAVGQRVAVGVTRRQHDRLGRIFCGGHGLRSRDGRVVHVHDRQTDRRRRRIDRPVVGLEREAVGAEVSG